MPETTWTVRGSREALRAVRPLIDAHACVRPVEVCEREGGDVVELSACGLTGYVPEHPDLPRFAQAAAAVARRAGPVGPVALLAQWDERYQLAAAEANGIAPAAFLWPARAITGRDLPAAVGIGFGACVYFGHGHCGGWDGYWGVDAPGLVAALTEPAGAVLSLTCLAAKRPAGGLSFCEELVLSGYCAAALGHLGRTSHRRNARLGIQFCRAMQDHETLAGVLAHSGASWLSLAGYRIAGDPLTRLVGAPAALERASAVEAGFWSPARVCTDLCVLR
jgi:hypothetical protein